MLSHFSHFWLFEILGTIALQAPLFMGFSRQEYWNGLPFPSPDYLYIRCKQLHVYLCVCLCCLLSRPAVTKLLLLLSSVHFKLVEIVLRQQFPEVINIAYPFHCTFQHFIFLMVFLYLPVILIRQNTSIEKTSMDAQENRKEATGIFCGLNFLRITAIIW